MEAFLLLVMQIATTRPFVLKDNLQLFPFRGLAQPDYSLQLKVFEELPG